MNMADKSRDELLLELQKLKDENQSLQTIVSEDETERQQIRVILRERLKELNCHRHISEILSNSRLTMEESCESILPVLPEAFQFPEEAEAAILVNEKCFQTPGYVKSKHYLSQNLKVYGQVVGSIEVCYPEDRLPEAEPLFLPEESDLMFTLSVRLSGLLERKQKEIDLFRSEEEYRNLIESINDVIYRIDLQGIIRYISPSVRRVLGYEPGEVIGRSFLQFVGESGDYLKERFQLLSEQQEIENEYTILGKDGVKHWIRLSTKAIIENGQFMGGTGTLVDITEKKRISLDLQKSEALYRSILNASPDVFVIMNREGLIQFVSLKALNLFGYDNFEAFLNHSILDFIDPRDLRKANQAQAQARQGILPESSEFRLLRSDGSYFHTEIDGDLIRDPEGNMVNMILIIRNISDRKQAEEKLRQSEETYRNLVEKISDVIYDISMDGKIKYISPVAERLLGYKMEELIGRSFLEFVYEPDRKRLMNRMMQGGPKIDAFIEYRYVDHAGDIRWVQTLPTNLMENGMVVGKTGTIIDITEKKRAEDQLKQQNERLSAVLSAMPDIVFIMDKDGNYLEYFADNVDDFLVPKEELVGKNLSDIFDKEQATFHLAKIRECIREKHMLSYDFSVVVNGVLRYYDIRMFLLSDDKVFRFARDITERKNAELQVLDLNTNLENRIRERTAELADINQTLLREIEERKRVEEDLRKARLESEEANLAKSEFLSRMSHELRTPMNSILGFAQLLDMGTLNPSQKKSVKHILRSGKMLLDLINEVLDISRIEAGKLSLSLEPVQISGIINEMMDVVYPLAKSRKISIEFQDSPTNALYVKSDKQRLKQVVLNLLTNAIKYNQVGGKITISSEPVPGDLVSKIRISITDTGLGIPSGSIDKIFNPFERLGAEKSETEGSGLGLSVVKKLLEAMNGAIGVESIPGDGSTFWFELPKCFSQRDTINLETLNSEDLKKHHKKGTILYIEDNISNIELFEQILFAQRSGIRLISSMNGKSALALAKGNSPDLIFLDLNLPDVHGSEILAQLAADKETSRIPVVILSADVLSGQVDRLLKAGARECLSKPLDILKLLNIIDEYIVD